MGQLCAARLSVPDWHHVVRHAADAGAWLGPERYVSRVAGQLLDERGAHCVYYRVRDWVDTSTHPDSGAGTERVLLCESDWRHLAAALYESNGVECKGKDSKWFRATPLHPQFAPFFILRIWLLICYAHRRSSGQAYTL